MATVDNTARNLCEAHLRANLASNREKNLLPKENAVIERLLARGEEVAPAYAQIHAQLRHETLAWKLLLEVIVSTGAFWTPRDAVEFRQERADLLSLNQQIAEHAEALADLLGQREELSNRAAFSSWTHYDICVVIAQASEGNGRFDSYIKEPLAHLNGRFDTKYWPSLAQCVRVIGEDAERARVEPSDRITQAATRSRRASNADFVRALLAAIDERRVGYVGYLPRHFELGHDAIAGLVNVLLDLAPEALVDGIYVKNVIARDARS